MSPPPPPPLTMRTYSYGLAQLCHSCTSQPLQSPLPPRELRKPQQNGLLKNARGKSVDQRRIEPIVYFFPTCSPLFQACWRIAANMLCGTKKRSCSSPYLCTTMVFPGFTPLQLILRGRISLPHRLCVRTLVGDAGHHLARDLHNRQ